MTELSDTQRIILSRAGRRDHRLAVPPERLPAAALQTVAKSLLKQGLVSEEPANAVGGAELGGLTPAEYQAEQTLAHRGGDGAGSPGRTEQAGCEGLLLHLPHRHRDCAGGGRLMRLSAPAPRLAVGPTRVSTAEQGQSGLGFEAQQASIRSFVSAQGWTLVAVFSDIASGKDDGRPGFQAALARCRQLDAVLVAARLDRITRRAQRIYAAMAQKERELISERTKAALAAAKARGTALGGDRGYRPAVGPDAALAAATRREAADRAAHRLHLEFEGLRAHGFVGHAELARALTARGVPTLRGAASWTHTTVARVERTGRG